VRRFSHPASRRVKVARPAARLCRGRHRAVPGPAARASGCRRGSLTSACGDGGRTIRCPPGAASPVRWCPWVSVG